MKSNEGQKNSVKRGRRRRVESSHPVVLILPRRATRISIDLVPFHLSFSSAPHSSPSNAPLSEGPFYRLLLFLFFLPRFSLVQLCICFAGLYRLSFPNCNRFPVNVTYFRWLFLATISLRFGGYWPSLS